MFSSLSHLCIQSLSWPHDQVRRVRIRPPFLRGEQASTRPRQGDFVSDATWNMICDMKQNSVSNNLALKQRAWESSTQWILAQLGWNEPCDLRQGHSASGTCFSGLQSLRMTSYDLHSLSIPIISYTWVHLKYIFETFSEVMQARTYFSRRCAEFVWHKELATTRQIQHRFPGKLPILTTIQCEVTKNPHVKSPTQIKARDMVTLYFLIKRRLVSYSIMSP